MTNSTDKFLQRLADAYIEAIYFTDTGDTDQPGSDAELSQDSRALIQHDVEKFWGKVCNFDFPMGVTYDQIMHDFWFTRNGHGVGFWDRPDLYGEKLSLVLTNIAEGFGHSYTYQADDGQLGVE